MAELFFAVNNKKQQPVQIDARDKSGNTPLHLALDYCLKFTAEILLRRGADVNLVNAEGLTPLHIICRKDYDAELVKIFFEITDDSQLKQQINAVDKKGRTPLQLAVANLLPDVVEFLLDHGADDLSGFVFPSESDLNEEFELQDYNILSDSPLRLASGMLACVELLEKRGFQLDRSDALAIMNVFAKHNVFGKPTDLDESCFDDESFARETKEIEVRPGLSLYDFVRSPPEEAAKLLTYMEYFRFSRSKYSQYHRQGPREACTAPLCQILSRGFFQRWSMDPVMELICYQLPILCCDMIIQQLSNKDLLNICLALRA
ncbi:unnamed protein product [Trichogramma brassicae]|uniref:Uncharacterized protein n=1 Tax=Trichogramma brassicae TaxID=86971 RepID=A0A6H5ISE6_9HYME|nr:unnamed protein product [Trichogramma brassicae]